jgi:Uma2 family endonuclease
MGLPQKAIATFTPEEYLALEQASDTKHEYLDGVIYAWQGPVAMTGASVRHNAICLNISTALRSHLRGTGCRVYMTDVKLRVAARNAFFYPDVLVTCSDKDRAAELILEEPTLVFEVSSDSTGAFDRGEKFDAYKQIPTLREYVIVSGGGRRVEVFSRDANWQPVIEATSGAVRLASIDATLSLETIYEAA